MTTNNISDIKDFQDKTSKLLDRRRLGAAILKLKNMAKSCGDYSVMNSLEQAEQTYAYMLKYMAQGTADPERDSVYADIVIMLYGILDELVMRLEKRDVNTLYYSTIRSNDNAAVKSSISQLLGIYAHLLDKTSLFSMAGGEYSDNDKRELERTQSAIFKAIWTTPLLSASDEEVLKSTLESEAFPISLKTHLLSALMLGYLQRPDDKKLSLIIEAYIRNEGTLEATALIDLLLCLWKQGVRPLSKNVKQRLEMAKDKESWSSDLRIAFIEMIRTRDTEHINKKINEEVIPSMMNLRPEILNKISGGKINPEEMANLEENPEWMEMLEKNGITDKLKELTDLQLEGADVMMSTFSHLKSFPFFMDISNWFLPFDVEHTSINSTAHRLGILSDMMENANFFCDSDKYSFMMALDKVPESQREFMTSQFQAQSDMIYEAMGQKSDSLSPEMKKRLISNYLQNIYRFFKLYSRSSEFADPFISGINLIALPSLANDFQDADLLEVVAEFYFRHNYMADALSVFTKLEDLDASVDGARFQKMGFANERLGNLKEAVTYYQQAELLDGSNKWTLRRLASCFRALGDLDMAYNYYSRLSNIDSEDLSTALLMGYVLLEKNMPKEALKQFYKVEFLDEKSTKAWRPLAWTLFLTGDLEGSQRYYDKILGDNPTASDYLNMGHVALASGRMPDAISSYQKSLHALGSDKKAFVKSFEADAQALKTAGVDESLLPLVADYILYM